VKVRLTPGAKECKEGGGRRSIRLKKKIKERRGEEKKDEDEEGVRTGNMRSNQARF
jgi:hypothetical protein